MRWKDLTRLTRGRFFSVEAARKSKQKTKEAANQQRNTLTFGSVKSSDEFESRTF